MSTPIHHFIGKQQLAAIKRLAQGEEGAFFQNKLKEIQRIVDTMPHEYQTESQKEKVIHLHYFLGGCDWHIIERDSSDEQLQAFGWANLGYGAEMGYIPIQEAIECGAELDLHWEPKVWQPK